MKIEVEMPGNPTVVSKLLVQETPGGPGDMEEGIVQVAGYAPFRVPKKYYQSAN